MNHPDFRAANGRIFASLHGDPQVGMAALTPADQQRFITAAPDVFHPAAGAWGAMGCTLIHLRHADEEAVGEAVTLAWQLALTKKPSKAKARSPRASTRARAATNGPASRRR